MGSGCAQAMPRAGRENGSNLKKSKQMFVTVERSFPECHRQQKGVKNNMILQKRERERDPVAFPLSSHITDREAL